ncbi:MAG: ABC transporter permease [Ruthenibacterium sp.]
MDLKEKKRIGWLEKLRRLPEFNLILILLLFTVVLCIVEPKFISFHNITNLLRQTSIIGVLAVGMTFVIISSGIDLSVGAVLAFGGMLVAMLMQAGVPVPLAILISLLAGTAIGVITGLLVHKGKVPAFIATLGGMSMVRGIVMLMSNANKVAVPKPFSDFAVAKILGIPAMVYVWLAIVLLGILISRYTTFGRNIYAIGSNEEAARLSGIRLGINICGIYAFCAFCASVAGLLMTTRLGSGTPTAGTGMELDAVAAVVVGGASLSGAVGSVFGTVLGTLIIAMIRNGGQLLGINSFVLDISVGALIVIAVLIDKLGKHGKR